ncbi:MAG: acyl-CoA thioesterase [Chlorobi bacterium]|nr:acyl-CoA thioesterase [Chlorobiota bacterium]
MAAEIFDYFLKTRYAETDQMGYIHHSVYPVYLEAARIEWLNKLGISYKELERKGILLPVYDLYIRYIIPLTFDELIRVRVRIKEFRGPRLIFAYEIYNQSDALATEAEVTLFFAGPDGKPVRPPADVAKILAPVTE